jgi:hypothetical protein
MLDGIIPQFAQLRQQQPKPKLATLTSTAYSLYMSLGIKSFGHVLIPIPLASASDGDEC